jgi:hypothetical protein
MPFPSGDDQIASVILAEKAGKVQLPPEIRDLEKSL